MEGIYNMTQISGKWVCFNCKTDGLPIKGRTKSGEITVLKPGVNMRKLEVRRAGKFGGKGKIVAEAYVCQTCYNQGNTKVPLGFNGFIPFKQDKHEDMLKHLLKKRDQAIEEQGSKPLHPQKSEVVETPVSSTPSSTENEK
jgi:hypothetical protein